MIYRSLIVAWILMANAHAMLSDGIHLPKDYIDYAHTQEAFKASCFVYDHQRHILQTGVLITPDIVMTAAHGFDGKINLHSIIVGFGDSVSRESDQNYGVKALRRHPSYQAEPFPLKAKYDMLFLKLTKPVKGIAPVPFFEEEVFEDVPPLYVATFGSADIPQGTPVRRRAFVLPEADLFSVSGSDPENLYDIKTVMMGAVFFEPANVIKPVRPNAPEREIRTNRANQRWHRLDRPPYALTLPGSSGAPVFMNLVRNGVTKTYVFGIVQSFAHLSDSTFRHAQAGREIKRLLKAKYPKLYGHYQSVFCIPYEVHVALMPGKKTVETYRFPAVLKKMLEKLKDK